MGSLTVISNDVTMGSFSSVLLDKLLLSVGYLKLTNGVYVSETRKIVDKTSDVEVVPILHIKATNGGLTFRPASKMFRAAPISELIDAGVESSETLNNKTIICRSNYMHYTCISIAVNIRADSSFMVEGRTTTYAQYFLHRYDMILDRKASFLLCQLESGGYVYLPADKCHIANSSAKKDACSDIEEIHEFLQLPEGQFVSLENLFAEFSRSAEIVNQLKMKCSFGNAKATSLMKLHVSKNLPGVQLKHVLILLPEEPTIQTKLRDFVCQFHAIMNVMGLEKSLFSSATYSPNDDPFDDFFEQAIQQGINVIITVVPKDAKTYRKIKTVALKNAEKVISQSLTVDSMISISNDSTKNNVPEVSSIMRNIICQVFAKQTPLTWLASPLKLPSTMLFGISIGPPRSDSTVVVRRDFAIIGSLNPQFTEWCSRYHNEYDEKKLLALIKKTFRNFYDKNNQSFPTSILVFVKGDSAAAMEGLFRGAIDGVCNILGFQERVNFAIYVVQKSPRTYMRESGEGLERIKTPTCVTTRNGFDLMFPNGEAMKVCEYTEIYNGFNSSITEIIEFSHRLSYSYVGDAGAPSLFPAPVQYAMKLQKFVNCIGYEDNKSWLESHNDKLFYL